MDEAQKGAILMGSQRKVWPLDKKDKLILQILIENSRTPLSVIGKRARLSKAGVLKRINSLVKGGVILEFIPITNPLAWGYQMYSVFISTDASTETEDCTAIKNSPYVWWLAHLSGRFNFQIIFLHTDSRSFYDHWGRLSKKLNTKDWKVMMFDDYGFQPYELFGVKSGFPEKTVSYSVELLDKVDAKILDCVKFNARKSLIAISQEIKISPERVKRRLELLYRRGAIQRYFTNFDIYSVGLAPYVLLIKLRDTTKRERLKKYLHESKHSAGVFSLVDEWTLGCIVEFFSIQDLRVFISDTVQLFPEISEYETMLLLDQVVCDMFPKGVYTEIVEGHHAKMASLQAPT